MLCKNCPKNTIDAIENTCLAPFLIMEDYDNCDWREAEYHIKIIDNKPHACVMNFYRLKNFLNKFPEFKTGILHSVLKQEYSPHKEEINKYTTFFEVNEVAPELFNNTEEEDFIKNFRKQCEHKEITVLGEKEYCRLCGMSRSKQEW